MAGRAHGSFGKLAVLFGVTFLVTLVVGVSNFTRGAWLVAVLVPILMWILLQIHRHYETLHGALDIEQIAPGKEVAAEPIVGVLFLYAAVTHDPDKSAGLDQALHKLLQQPFGSPVLVLVALGFACYGLFAFAWARHLDR